MGYLAFKNARAMIFSKSVRASRFFWLGLENLDYILGVALPISTSPYMLLGGGLMSPISNMTILITTEEMVVVRPRLQKQNKNFQIKCMHIKKNLTKERENKCGKVEGLRLRHL
jgi:hypothetical protein